MAELILVNLITVIVIGAAMIAACRSICRVAPRIRMPTALVGVHVVVVVATVIPSLFGVGGGPFPYDDQYIPFFLYPGVLLDYANGRFAYLFWPWLQDKVGYHQACYLTIVAIPALLTALAGAAAWLLVARLLQRRLQKQSADQAPHSVIPTAPDNGG